VLFCFLIRLRLFLLHRIVLSILLRPLLSIISILMFIVVCLRLRTLALPLSMIRLRLFLLCIILIISIMCLRRRLYFVSFASSHS